MPLSASSRSTAFWSAKQALIAAGFSPRAVRIASVYQAPFLKQFAIVAGRGAGNLEIVDVTGREPQLPLAGVVEAVGRATGVDVESFPLDRLVGFDGKPLKDVSHPGARLFSRSEIERILHAEVR